MFIEEQVTGGNIIKFLRNCKGFQVILQSKSGVQEKEKGGGRKGGSLKEGKVQWEKVERENGECTCNLTVMKGSPGKETKPKWSDHIMEGGGKKNNDEKAKKRERKKVDLEFPARCLRMLHLPSWSLSPHEMRKPSRPAPRLYLVNHQHYKPVLQALWGQKYRERERRNEKRLAKKLLPVKDKLWNKKPPEKSRTGVTFGISNNKCVQQTVAQLVQLLPSGWKKKQLNVSHCCTGCPVDWFVAYSCPRFLPVGSEACSGNSALCAGMWLHCEVNGSDR